MSEVTMRSRIWQDASEVGRVLGGEFRRATLPQRAALGALACTFAFEWSTGNEALLGLVGGHVLEKTNDAALTAAVTGSVSFAEQTVFGVVAAIGIKNFPVLMSSVRSVFQKDDEEVPKISPEYPVEDNSSQELEPIKSKSPFSASKFAGRFIDAFTLGTAFNAIKNNAVEERSLARNAKEVVIDAGLIGSGVAVIAGTVAIANNAGRAWGAEAGADIFVDVITNPWTYAAIFGLKIVGDTIKRYRPQAAAEIEA